MKARVIYFHRKSLVYVHSLQVRIYIHNLRLRTIKSILAALQLKVELCRGRFISCDTFDSHLKQVEMGVTITLKNQLT
jgi:hypothetical protein